MRFSCKVCQATFQTASGAPASAAFRCPSCGGEMAAVAEVVELWQDRMPTRRYDLEDLRARLDLEREEAARARGASQGNDQIWFAAVQGRQVGPLSVVGIAGLRARGQLSAASLVWREGWPSWVAAEAIPELRAILGLPEEKPGQPFPVAPQDPAPPPFDSTYAAARHQQETEPFDEAGLLRSAQPPPPPEPTDPNARLHAFPEEKTQPSHAAGEGFALAPPGDLPHQSAGEETQVEEVPQAPQPVLAVAPARQAAPPAIPRADNTELEQAASAVFAQAHSTERAGGAAPTVPAFTSAHHLVDQLSQSSSPGTYRLAPDAAPGAPASFVRAAPEVRAPAAEARPAPEARIALPSNPRPVPQAPAVPDAPLRMIDLSDTASSSLPAAEMQPSRPRQQQQWFAQADDRSEPDSRSRWLLVGALVLAVIVVSLLLRTH